ncbi:MAG: DNA topoisomerase IB [Ignavibacteria bacterium]|nr:DNA topoisomerase IB [Ignavibacteria bacterium]
MKNITEVKIIEMKLNNGLTDAAQSAKSVNLVYVSNSRTGYTRIRKGKSFIYHDGNKRIKDKSELERLKKLVLPPAWENVWICRVPNGHLQATGIDKLGRKQYKYHSDWSIIRNRTKYNRLYEFGNKLPAIRKEINKNLKLSGYNKEKVLSALLSVMDITNIRVGSSLYEKLYGSFGLTTLKNRHVNIKGANIKFSFKGKRGIKHSISLKSKRLAAIIRACKEIPGKELFEYINDEGEVVDVDSGTVNEFIQKITGGDFTAKDFRTWSGSVEAILSLKELGGYESITEMKKKIAMMYESVAGKLGNTKAVCKKYYIHPFITELYEKNKLEKYISKLKPSDINGERTGLSSEEKVLMAILNKAR